MRNWATVAVLGAALVGAPAAAPAQLRAELVVGGLSAPVAIAQDPARPDRQLIGEQGGRIRVVTAGVLQSTDFLDLADTVTAGGGERGLLGVAFSPDFASTGRVFVSFTDAVGNSVVSRFTRASDTPLVGDPSSRFDLRWGGGAGWIEQPFTNHNGGHLAFGSDGYLYVGLGDGGSGNDPMNLAQDPSTLLGKMLRLDVSVPATDPEGYDVPADNPFVGTAVLPEIWAVGLRNPWRFSFDDPARGGTGALVIGDVGQGAWEEIDYQPAGAGGRNYGWRYYEGAHPNVTSQPLFSAATPPVFEYDHSDGRSITGGVVYRGTALDSAFAGRYFFADFVFGRVWSIRFTLDGGGEATATDLVEHSSDLGAAAASPSSFGVDGHGELLLLSYGAGQMYRIASAVPPPAPVNDCATPDPFVVLGGGTCVDGGWLPPGIAPPSSTPPPTPGDGGGTSSPSTGGCATPDPFAIFGGGTCVNGEWLPPGIAPPSSPPPPSPPPSEGTGGTPPSSGGCGTPDPFAILGGGTCVNGEWLPPGIAPAPSPAPPSTPPPGGGAGGAPPSTPGGCTTPDPFVILGGGTCVNGGWLPPGYPAGGG